MGTICVVWAASTRRAKDPDTNPPVVKFPQRLSEIFEVPLQLQSIVIHIRQAWTLLESYEHGKVLAMSFD
jgi:hypothetical protein